MTPVAAACGCTPPHDFTAAAWRCPRCFTRYAQTIRWVGGTRRAGWTACRDDFETFRLREDAAFHRFARRVWLACAAVLMVGLVAVLSACTPAASAQSLPIPTGTPSASPAASASPSAMPAASATHAAAATHAAPAASVAPVAMPGSTVCRSVNGHADPACTPGGTNPAVTQATIGTTICKTGWTSTVRPPTSVTDRIKSQVMRSYGITLPAKDVELDHLVPLELGGNPDGSGPPSNLWPQPWNGPQGAHVKDAEENRLRSAVCARQMTLADAQAQILRDWR